VTIRYAAALAIASVTAAFAAGCTRDGCVGGDDRTCLPASACQALRYACDSSQDGVRVAAFEDDAMPLRDPKARGVRGDIVLENDLVRVVLAGPGHAADLAPTGGWIVDLAPKAAGSGDQINSIYQAAGLLPRDAVHYEGVPEQHTGRDDVGPFKAVVFRGRLEADSRVTVVTRYEMRACEPGVRVSSDLFNGAAEPNTLYLADGLFWGDNSAVPFAPGTGLGFRAPKLDLEDVASAWREWPFVAARSQASPDSSYAIVPCDRPQLAGFNNPTMTTAGVPLTTTLPGDGIHFERFIIAAAGPGLAPAAAEALRARAMLHDETAPVTISGRVVAAGAPIDGRSGRAASLLFYEAAFGSNPDDPARRTPWNEAVPGPDGRFSVVLPADRSFRVQPYAFGLPAAPASSFFVGHDDVDIGDITLVASARLIATVSTTPGQPTPSMMTYAELVVVPVATMGAAEPPSLYGLFAGCNPMLGPPHGASPACNRALSRDGRFDLLVPPGQYLVYGTRGPFATIDRTPITVAPGDEVRAALVVQSLPILPGGVISGDFHVHGAASYDSSFPDQDRVVSFLAAGVDVIVASDHDVITTYEKTLTDLSLNGRIKIIPGVEQTPNIPWFAVPGEDFPQTLGHMNFWPLQADSMLPGNGAPWDELREPGQMMDDITASFGAGLRQLNHPFARSKLGRDLGFLTAIGYDPRTPIVAGASFAADTLLHRPGGGVRNLDWDVQEVMNGSSRADWLRERAFWFSLLSQGILRAGTANSDSHSLALEHVGYPRNLVFGEHHAATLDLGRFAEDIRRGHMVGTNGPFLDVVIEDGPDVYRPGLDPIGVTPDAQLVVNVSAAPWIPVEHLRVIVNGRIVGGRSPGEAVDVSSEFIGADHLATSKTTMNTKKFRLSSLLEGGRDAWLVVEVGAPLPAVFDPDDDGLPDLVDPNARPDRNLLSDYAAIVPGAWPLAFTNPFLIDVDGNGYQAPGLTP
jgi:hypothetical protein